MNHLTIKVLIISLLFLGVHTLNAQRNAITFGIISDVHEDLQKDATARLQTFLDDARQKKPDFIIQLGDLCHSTGADKILGIWNSYENDKYSVFGNHDMDHAAKKEMIQKYNMPAGHYYFDRGGVRFIVLDCAFTRKNGQLVDYDNGNYFVKGENRDLISDAQLRWIEEIIASCDYPCVIFSHQAFDEIGGSVPNREELRKVIRTANKDKKRVIACICGHHHIDGHTVIDGVDYIQINSASYFWVEGNKKYSNGNMAEYEDAVYAFVTIYPKKKKIVIKGIQSEFKKPAPSAEDFSKEQFPYINAGISDRVIRY